MVSAVSFQNRIIFRRWYYIHGVIWYNKHIKRSSTANYNFPTKDIEKALTRNLSESEQAEPWTIDGLVHWASSAASVEEVNRVLHECCSFWCLARPDSFSSLLKNNVEFKNDRVLIELKNLKGEKRNNL